MKKTNRKNKGKDNNKIIRLAFLAPEFYNTWGGVGIYSIRLIKDLANIHDLEVHVITPDVLHPNPLDLPDSVHIHTLSLAKDSFFYNFKFQIALGLFFRKLHKTYHFDLIHSANLVHMPDIFLKFGKEIIPSIVTIHTTISGQVKGFLKGNKNILKMAPSEKMSLLVYPYIKFMEWVYMKRTKHIITVSNKFKRLIAEEYGKQDHMVAIHNSIDATHYNPDTVTVQEAQKKFPLLKKIKRPVLLFAGRIITQKGIEVFMKSLAELKEKGESFDAIIAGKGDTEQLKRLIKEYALESHVHFVGYVPNQDLVYLYKKTDIFVLPSYYENLPISILEAMSMKCACVGSDVGAVKELIDHNKTGFIMDAGNVSQLTGHITTLLHDKKKRLLFGKVGRKKVLEYFTPEIMAHKTYTYYQEVLKAKK